MTKASDPFEVMEQRGEQAKQSAAEAALEREQAHAAQLLGKLVQKDQYLGETLRMDFRNVAVQVHDHHRRGVGGIPHLSYLVASRIQHWKKPISWAEEDACVLLLRVLGAAPTPSDMIDGIVRAEAARRATGNETDHWETMEYMDGYTRHQLSFAGLTCEVVGTFYLGRQSDTTGAELELRFGTDINNFYPNQGLKVYKPVGEALREIVNFRDPLLTPEHALRDYTVPIGHVRYASTNRPMQGVDEVDVWIPPVDLLAQRTALFGMSRTGKSNTTKIIARAIYNLRRAKDAPIKVGQIIFDYNGEYANENTQGGDDIEANALKNVWREQGGLVNDVVTYGFTRPDKDPSRKQLRINAYGNDVPNTDWVKLDKLTENLDMMLVGKQILDDLLVDQSSIYIKNFVEVDLSIPDTIGDYGVSKRYQRTVLAYRALLAKAGLTPPEELLPSTTKLFNPELLKKMRESPNDSARPRYQKAADLLDAATTPKPSWLQVANALETLAEFVGDKNSGYKDFLEHYLKSSKSGEEWADTRSIRIIDMFRRGNGPKLVARLLDYHNDSNTQDFAEAIYHDLLAGKLVIVDQASGDPLLNIAAARRVMWKIFKGNQASFTKGESLIDILVYVEEAHNLLPTSKEDDFTDVWVRTAKEGSKYRIGLVYATQEVSSIQRNILKNTANWFISHLNNTDETRELRKFYDFANFEDSILRAQNRGFLRVKMLSNPYINPVQVQHFVLDLSAEADFAEDGDDAL